MVYKRMSAQLLVCELTQSEARQIGINSLDDVFSGRVDIKKITPVLGEIVTKPMMVTGFSRDAVIEIDKPINPTNCIGLYVWDRDFYNSKEFKKQRENNSVCEESAKSDNDDMDFGDTDEYYKYFDIIADDIFEATKILNDINNGLYGVGFTTSLIKWDNDYHILISCSRQAVASTVMLSCAENAMQYDYYNEDKFVALLKEHGEIIL